MALITAHRQIAPYTLRDNHMLVTITVYDHANDFAHSMSTAVPDWAVATPESTGDDNLTIMGYEPPLEWIEISDDNAYAFAVLQK